MIKQTSQGSIEKKSAPGFTLVETLAVVAILGILSSISAPSFMNWRRNQIIQDAANSLAVDLSSVGDDARRWGASCNIQLNSYADAIKPVVVNCRADGSEKSMRLCGRKTNCNIASRRNQISSLTTDNSGKNLVAVVGNVPSVAYTPRGQLASTADIVFIVQGTARLGNASGLKCIVLNRVTGEVKLGNYRGARAVVSNGRIPISRSLNSSLCS